jgi:hypothetical protein
LLMLINFRKIIYNTLNNNTLKAQQNIELRLFEC